jgi:hypothetical protein
VDKPLSSLGLDSLMAVEIGNRMQSELGVGVPPVKFLEGLTTAGMAQYLIEQLTADDRTARDAPAASVNQLEKALGAAREALDDGNELARVQQTSRLMAAVEALSDHDVDSLLQQFPAKDTASVGEDAR